MSDRMKNINEVVPHLQVLESVAEGIDTHQALADMLFSEVELIKYKLVFLRKMGFLDLDNPKGKNGIKPTYFLTKKGEELLSLYKKRKNAREAMDHYDKEITKVISND